jgi:MATE family multidrug resistance protein
LSAAPPASASLADSARRILPLAWPVVVGQLSVLAFTTVDTVLVARASAADLAALAVGTAAYVSVFIGFMGTLMALAPVIGQLHGAGRDEEAGRQVHQGLWIAFVLSVLGVLPLCFPGPFLALAGTGADVTAKVRSYLLALAFSLPAALAFTVYRAFNTAVARPKAVMALQLVGLGLKLPLSGALVFGLPAIGLPALGVTGCGIATALAMWAQLLVAAALLRRDPFYQRFRIRSRGLDRPDAAALRQLLRLGLPMGASILIEVTGFAFMAIFIARLGITAVAGHQVVANMVSVLFMVPLGLASASGTLVAQHIGAGRLSAARRLGGHGVLLGGLIAAAFGAVVYGLRDPVLRLYSQDAAVLAAATPLVAWLVIFHIGDALQTVAAFVLRAYKIATLPMIIYVAALWGVGLGGGGLLAFNVPGGVPAALQGAGGFWFAATAGIVLAGALLSGLMAMVFRRQQNAFATDAVR